MKFEEFENLWAAQPATPARVPSLDDCRRRMQPELARRGRFHGYALFCFAVFFVVYPLLACVNARHTPPAQPVLYWTNAALHLGFMGLLLGYTLRLRRRQRALARESAGSVKQMASVSLRNVESELAEYRANRWVMPILGALTLLSLVVNAPAGAGAAWWGPRLAFTAGYYAFTLGLFAFHARANLKPAHARWSEVLKQLE